MKYRKIVLFSTLFILSSFFVGSAEAQWRRNRSSGYQPRTSSSSPVPVKVNTEDSAAPAPKKVRPAAGGPNLTPAQEKDVKETIRKAFELFHQGDIQRAAHLISLAGNLDPTIAPPFITMAKWVAAVGRFDVARAFLDDAVDRHPEDPESFLLLADLAAKENRRTEAMLLLARGQELLEVYDKSPLRKEAIEKTMWSNLAALAEMRRDFDGALACVDKLVEMDGESSDTFSRRGVFYFRRNKPGDEKLALEAFEKSYELDETRLPAKARLSELVLQKGETEKAETLLKEAVEKYPDNVALMSFVASFHLRLGHLEEAKKAADRLYERFPEAVEVEKLRGQLDFALGKYDAAEASFRKVLEKAPLDANAAEGLVMILLEKKDQEGVAEAFKLAEENVRRTSSQEMAVLLARALFLEDKKDAADRIVDQAVAAGPFSTNCIYYAAEILADRGKKETAVQLLRLAVNDGTPFFKRSEAEKLLEKLTTNQ